MNPKAVLFASVSLLALTSAPAVRAQSGLPSWTGSYFGVNAGAAFRRTQFEDIDDLLGFGPGSVFRGNTVGPTFGAQTGYNFQFDRIVFGIEADINEVGGQFHRIDTNAGTFFTSEMNWLATVRGRLGFVWNGSGWNPLIYVTGGAAFTNINNSFGLTDGSGAFFSSGGRTGVVYGGGIEQKFDRNWSVKIEALFVDFGRKNATIVIDSKNGPSTFRASFRDAMALIRGGVNFHW